MLKHILTMAWNRKKANSLVLLELVAAYLIIAVICGALLYQYNLYKTPLGFNYDNVWSVEFEIGGPWDEQKRQRLSQIRHTLNNQAEIDEAHNMTFSPFIDSGWTMEVLHDGKQDFTYMGGSTDGMQQAIGMTLVEGRWFGKADDGQSVQPAVINQRLKDSLLGDRPAIGKIISIERNFEQDPWYFRVVGVFEDYRQHGELTEPANYLFVRFDDNNPNRWFSGMALVMKPDTPLAYQEKLMHLLTSAAPDWDFNVQTWAQLRRIHLKEKNAGCGIDCSSGRHFDTDGVFWFVWCAVAKRDPSNPGNRVAPGTGGDGKRCSAIGCYGAGLFCPAGCVGGQFGCRPSAVTGHVPRLWLVNVLAVDPDGLFGDLLVDRTVRILSWQAGGQV